MKSEAQRNEGRIVAPLQTLFSSKCYQPSQESQRVYVLIDFLQHLLTKPLWSDGLYTVTSLNLKWNRVHRNLGNFL